MLLTHESNSYMCKSALTGLRQKSNDDINLMSNYVNNSETRAITYIYYFSAFTLPESSVSKYVASNYTYVAVLEQVRWYEALALCSFHGRGFYLASFSTEAEKKEIHSWLHGLNGEVS